MSSWVPPFKCLVRGRCQVSELAAIYRRYMAAVSPEPAPHPGGVESRILR